MYLVILNSEKIIKKEQCHHVTLALVTIAFLSPDFLCPYFVYCTISGTVNGLKDKIAFEINAAKTVAK